MTESLLKKWCAFLDEEFVFDERKEPLDIFDEALDEFEEEYHLTERQMNWILEHEDFPDELYQRLDLKVRGLELSLPK